MLDSAVLPNPVDEATIAFRDSVLSNFMIVDDPRTREARVLHKLSDILFMTLCAVICGANSVKEIATYVKGRTEWFSALLSGSMRK